MVRYSSIVSGLFVVLLSFLRAITPCVEERQVTNGPICPIPGISALSESDQLLSLNPDNFSYDIKVKKKITKRFRARYCDYLFFPPVETLQEFYVAGKLTYIQPGYFFSKWSQFSSQLRGPPSNLQIG